MSQHPRVAIAILCTLGALGALGAVESGIPSTSAYAPGQRVCVIDPGGSRISRIGWLAGYLVTADQHSGPGRVWDMQDIANPRLVADLGTYGSGAHNFGYALDTLVFGSGQGVSVDGWRGTPRRSRVYSRWEGSKLYAYPLAIEATDGYLAQSANRNFNFFDLRDGTVYGRYNPYGEAGIVAKPIVIGNLLIAAGHHHRGGVATYDISDLSNPRLLDVLPGVAGYEPSVWGHLLVMANGSAAEGIGQPHGVVFVDFSDPTDLRIAHTITDPGFYSNHSDNPIPGDPRYAQFQDEYMFVGNAKVDMRTFQTVQAFTTGLDQFEEYPMPFGNFVAIGGHGQRRVSVFCHQRAPDTRPPMVNWQIPRPDSTDVAVSSRIGFVVPETLDPWSLRDGETVILRPVGGAAHPTIVSLGHDDIVHLWPERPLLDDTTYEVVLTAGGMRDAAGNAIESDISWRFSTGSTLDGGPTVPGNQLPTVSLDAPASGARFAAPADIALAASAADADGTVVRVDFLVDGSVVASDTSAPYTGSWSNVAAGTYSLSARAVDDEGASRSSGAITVTVSQPRAPFGGTAAAIPGTLEAEDYDLGGAGVAYADADATNRGGAYRSDGVDIGPIDGGHTIGWMSDGEWLAYTVEAAAGTYVLSLRVASALATAGDLRVLIDGTQVAVLDGRDTGGWAVFEQREIGEVTLSAGFHDIRVEVVGGGLNFDRMVFAPVAAPPPPPPAPAPEIAAVTVDAYPVAPGSSATLDVGLVTDHADYEYRWTLGDDTPRGEWSSSSAISHTYPGPGHYRASVQVRNPAGDLATGGVVVTVSATPPAQRGRTSGPIALDPAARRVAVVNPDNASAALLDADGLGLAWEAAVGADPRGVAFDASGRVWVACRGSHELVVLAAADGAELGRVRLPYGSGPVQVLFAPDGSGYVSCESSGRLARIDAAGLRVDAWLELGPWPRALALDAAGGTLYVSRFRSGPDAGAVYRVDLAGFSLDAVLPLGVDPGPDGPSDSRGVPGFLAGFAFDPFGQALWVAGNKFNTGRGLQRDGQPLNHENTVRTMLAPLALDTGADLVDQRRDIDNADSATAVLYSPLGDYQIVALQGNDLVEVIDRYSGERVARLAAGSAPQGLVLDPATGRLFVKNFLSRDVSVIELDAFLRRGDPVATDIPPVTTVASEALAASVLAGKRHFYLAGDERMSSEGYISCATCHVEAREDGQVWDFTHRGEGLRNTITLRGRRGTGQGRVHWSGNFDEIQDFEHDIRGDFAGRGFIPDDDFHTGTRNQPLGDAKAGLSPELDAIAAYLTSLDTVADSPHRADDGGLTAAGVRGRAVFERLDCASCHGGDDFTISAEGALVDVGTIKPSSGQRLGEALGGIDVPTLRGVWATAPYLHDGSAASIDAVFEQGSVDGGHGAVRALSASDRADLVAFLKQIDSSEPAVPRAPGNRAPTITAGPSASPAAPEVDTSVAFSAAASDPDGDALSYRWDFGDGTTATGASASHAYTAAGDYTVELVVSDGELSASASLVVSVSAPPPPPPPSSADGVVRAGAVPTIDGLVDAAWAGAVGYDLEHQLAGTTAPGSDLGARWRALWSSAGLAVLIEVDDDVLVRDSDQFWYDDTVELYIDADLSAGTSYDGQDDVQLAIGYERGAPNVSGTLHGGTDGVETALARTGSGYAVEIFVPAAALGWTPAVGRQLGFDVHVHDDDDGGTRDAKHAWHATVDQSWRNPSLFAVVELIPGSAPPANTAPTIAAIADQRMTAGETRTLTIAVDDAESDAGSLSVSASAADGSVLPADAIAITGSGATRSLQLSPPAAAAGTTTVTVQVDDGELQASTAFSLEVEAPAPATGGWQGSYFANMTLGGTPRTRIDPAISFDWGRASPGFDLGSDRFSVRWTGTVTPVGTGTHTFHATADDGVRVSVGGTRVVDDWSDHAARTTSGTIALEAGVPVNVVVEYYENGGNARVRLEWEGPGLTREDVPAATPADPSGPDPSLPAGWTYTDIGAVGRSGSAQEIDGAWTVTASGADIWNRADEGGLVWREIVGDATITARVASLQRTDVWAKAGLMVRQSLEPGSPHAFVCATGANGTAFQRRLSQGATSQHTAGPNLSAPCWLRLERRGDTLIGSASADGTTWREIRRIDLSLGDPLLLGLAVTSHDDGTACTAVFTDLDVQTIDTAN